LSSIDHNRWSKQAKGEKEMHFFLWVVLGALAGWVTGRVLEANQYGPGVDIVMGIGGATVSGFLLQYGGFPGRFEIVSTVLSVVLGAVALTALTAFVNGRKRYA
jgi:uncharacterized membrane protein YeaQ/YmgE (transglycosylase-associated protein family)